MSVNLERYWHYCTLRHTCGHWDDARVNALPHLAVCELWWDAKTCGGFNPIWPFAQYK